MKYLEIEVTDLTALEWCEIKKIPTERHLVFYMCLKYHMTKHMLKNMNSANSESNFLYF